MSRRRITLRRIYSRINLAASTLRRVSGNVRWILGFAEKLADKADRLLYRHRVGGYPVISDQIKRSSLSIGANIAEAMGRESARDRLRHLYIARGSLEETLFWLRRLQNRAEKQTLETMSLHASYLRLLKSLEALIETHRTRNNLSS